MTIGNKHPSTKKPDDLNRIYPCCPRTGVGVVVLSNHKVLLIKRGQEPSKGLWTVPGGLVELGETIEQAIEREIFEECHIHIRIDRALDVFEYIENEQDKIRYHYIVLEYLAHYIDGELAAASDIDDAGWFSWSEVQNLETSTKTVELVSKALGLK